MGGLLKELLQQQQMAVVLWLLWQRQLLLRLLRLLRLWLMWQRQHPQQKPPLSLSLLVLSLLLRPQLIHLLPEQLHLLGQLHRGQLSQCHSTTRADTYHKKHLRNPTLASPSEKRGSVPGTPGPQAGGPGPGPGVRAGGPGPAPGA